MSVIFEATIKMDGEEWYIELKDTLDGRVRRCNDIEDFAKQVEELGDDYGGHVDEVRWSKDEDVTEQAMDEIRLKMAQHRAEIEEEMGEPITPVAQEIKEE